MTHDEIKAARKKLGLTQAQLAYMMDSTDRMVRRVESPPHRSTHQPAPTRWIRLLEAYLDGHRPRDWPRTQD